VRQKTDGGEQMKQLSCFYKQAKAKENPSSNLQGNLVAGRRIRSLRRRGRMRRVIKGAHERSKL